MSKKKIKAVAVKETITLHLDEQKIVIQRKKDPELFEEVNQLILNKDEQSLIDKFASFKERLEKFSGGSIHFTEEGTVRLKGSSEDIPSALVKQMIHLEKSGEDFLPLIRFWRKLKQNPSKNSRDQLYAFILANNIQLTEMGDLVLEKGVYRKTNGAPEEFVDTHSGTVDYTIGCVTSMPREKVVDNHRTACAPGLHVAPPSYVRQHYGLSIILECIVSPTDVVSVPTDYNARKIRVCRLQVAGYSPKEARSNSIVRLSDFITIPPSHVIENARTKNEPSIEKKQQEVAITVKATSQVGVKQIGNDVAASIAGMSASKIIEYVAENTGFKITISVKNKSAIVKKAIEVLSEYQNTLPEIEGEQKQAQLDTIALEDHFKQMSASQIIKEVFEKTGNTITISVKNKSAIVKEAVRLTSIHQEVKVLNDTKVKEEPIEQATQQSQESLDAGENNAGENEVVEQEAPKAEVSMKDYGLQTNQDETDKAVKEIVESESTMNLTGTIDSIDNKQSDVVQDVPSSTVKTVNLTNLSKKEIQELIKTMFNEKIGGMLSSRGTVIQQATEILEKAGWIVV